MCNRIDPIWIQEEEEPGIFAGGEDSFVARSNLPAQVVAAEIVLDLFHWVEWRRSRNGNRVMLSGMRSRLPGWCQPAPSHSARACALGATWTLISLRCSAIASALTAGMVMAAPTALCVLGERADRLSAPPLSGAAPVVDASADAAPSDDATLSAAGEAVHAAPMSSFDPLRRPAHQMLELASDSAEVRKAAPVTLDLGGIAKDYGVDRLAETLGELGIRSGLVGIVGEMRALDLRPDGEPQAIAIAARDPDRCVPRSILRLPDAAVATSGDYRHGLVVGGPRRWHTIDPARGGPGSRRPPPSPSSHALLPRLMPGRPR